MEPKLEEMGAFFNTRCEDYDQVHTAGIDGGLESKRVVAGFLPDNCRALLDLGIGTGLELEAIYRRFPGIQVTGVDLAGQMLSKLREKYPGKELELINGSYFDFDMGTARYDCVLTVMTLHHYTHPVKRALYRRIWESLAPGGAYVEGDYMLAEEEWEDAQAMEDFYFAEYERLKREQGLDGGKEYHYDTPCTVKNQLRLLGEAGFSRVRLVWRVKNNAILVAEK